MSSKAKRKGYAAEIWLRDKHLQQGIPCERVPLSGLMGGKYDGDLAIPNVEQREFSIESKARKNGTGFKTLETWMQDKQIMFLKRNHQNPLVVMDFDTYMKLMKSYYELG
jgi:hypothetical protein